MRGLAMVLDVSCRLITVVLSLLLAVMVIVMVSLVTLRYGFSYSPSWSEEITRFCLVWMVMLGGATLVLFEDHLRLDLLDRLLPRNGRKFQRLYVQIVILIPCIVIAYQSIPFAMMQSAIMASGVRISLFIPSLSIPVGMILICICSALVAARIVLTEFLGVANVDLPDQRKYMYNVLSLDKNDEI